MRLEPPFFDDADFFELLRFVDDAFFDDDAFFEPEDFFAVERFVEEDFFDDETPFFDVDDFFDDDDADFLDEEPPFFEADFDEDFDDDDLRDGTLSPSERASEMPIAMACWRLFTFPPEPLFNFPSPYSCITFEIFFWAFDPYFAMTSPFPKNEVHSFLCKQQAGPLKKDEG